MKTLTLLACGAAMAALGAPALAQSKGDMTLGFGVHSVMPRSSSSTTTAGQITVGDNIRPTLTFEYFVADRIGIEVLAAWPFEHDIKLAGAGKVGKTKHLPPTVSVQYHFVNSSSITPFIGAGVTYVTFFDDKGTGALAGTDIDLDDSWGFSAHAGVDIALSERSAIRLDARYMDIDTSAKVGGAKIGTVHIDPLVVGAAYVMKF
ncbi:outer membrane beta-barrel protein [Roseovarius sp. SCSIO 43702]|uniref:OmpW/AlkL family protein n=1 Tax=Roseovarius sp. SCSIO 43702 TaxID=2823043 RepID=UPI001C72C56C|nr:OmpW family outer membrane protein [Roseovarius sp. SCSIO 43702]QYX55638.1 outer membrane beta-barrel protein [Roseovarius sp. SCSIO 43702]